MMRTQRIFSHEINGPPNRFPNFALYSRLIHEAASLVEANERIYITLRRRIPSSLRPKETREHDAMLPAKSGKLRFIEIGGSHLMSRELL